MNISESGQIPPVIASENDGMSETEDRGPEGIGKYRYSSMSNFLALGKCRPALKIVARERSSLLRYAP
jgi:hypothetical protein